MLVVLGTFPLCAIPIKVWSLFCMQEGESEELKSKNSQG